MRLDYLMQVIRREVKTLLRQVNVPFDDMRGVGIQISKLEGNVTGLHRIGGAKFVSLTSSTFSTTLGVSSTANPRNSAGSKSILSFMKRKSEQQLSEESVKRIKVETPKEEELSDITMSQVDPEFLSALPDDLRLEVENNLRQSKPKGKPKPETPVPDEPIPGPSSRNSPPSSASLLDATISQVDPEYLAALPEEIRSEIQENCASNSRRQMEEEENKRKMSAADSSKSEKSTLEMSFSQVDPEYLAALPSDIAEELRAEMEVRVA